MRQQTYRHRRTTPRSRVWSWLGIVLCTLLALIGVVLLIGWFRASHDAEEESRETLLSSSTTETEDDDGMIVDSSATVVRQDGTTAGTLFRRGSALSAEYNGVLALDPLQGDDFYAVWMVKGGLADVVAVGVLSPRADGTFSAVFSSTDPRDFATVVVMRTRKGEEGVPSGDIVARAVFSSL